MHRMVAVAIVAALALVAASCGGTETTTLGRAALVRRVEVACREASATAARETRAAGRTSPFAGIQAGQKALLDRLEGLEGSGAAKADFDAYKEGMRARLAAIDKVVSASRADRQRVLRSIQADAMEAATRIEAAVRRLGIRGCG